MSTTDDTNAARRGSGSNDLLGPLPQPDLQADPCSADGTQTDYYTAGTVRRLLAAERERCEARFHAALAAGRDVLDRQVREGVRAYVEQTIRNEWIRGA